ncbi:proteasome assembly chaperone family protein [Homoserinibacter sp. YIM 151385]|uniref:proteasome assembly chaperone family protein n=1 Tax=Homoserinibacter sp. YIM 151385 TaxID=2985506 RepID=UPI0022F0945A|nr:PAC2 family protein [Homoserinibacter sp. YIM 151385]WBU38555.1 PAC2 family protein [Homoserinibacter sp. YIM 151385]
MTQGSGFGDGPVVVVAFEGWNDAGEAASGVARAARDQLDLVPTSRIEPEDYFDYQFNRPSVAIDEHGERVLTWPEVVLWGPAPDAPDEGVRVLLGTEPSRGWKTFSAEIVDQLLAVEARAVVFLGAMLADVPHTRPISVFTSSENAEVRRELELERSSYEGPVGILSVLADAAERGGIPTLSIWASVPHYVHNAPSPKAVLAMMERLDDFLPRPLERGDLVDESAAWESGIDALAGDDEDMAAYITQLEQARDTVDSPEASGDAIAEEFERYLRRRDRPGEDRPGGP